MYRIEVLGDISQGLGNELDRIKVGTSGGEPIGEVNAIAVHLGFRGEGDCIGIVLLALK